MIAGFIFVHGVFHDSLSPPVKNIIAGYLHTSRFFSKFNPIRVAYSRESPILLGTAIYHVIPADGTPVNTPDNNSFTP